MSKLENKIEACDRTVFQVLNEKKYTVDYFQREYNWQKQHIEQLLTVLCSCRTYIRSRFQDTTVSGTSGLKSINCHATRDDTIKPFLGISMQSEGL